MYEISAGAVIDGSLEDIWSVSIDVDHWADWDPHEQEARLEGPFVTGATGWSKPAGGPSTTWTVTDVRHQECWSTTCTAPGTRLCGTTTFQDLGNGTVRCHKVMTVTGLLVPLFRLYFGPRIGRDMDATFSALEVETARRSVPAP